MLPIIAVLLLSPIGKEPTYGPWHNSRIGGGGYLQGVVIAPSDPKRYYVWVDVAGFFRSDDGGRTYRSMLGSLPAKDGSIPTRTFSVDPRNADVILVGTGTEWSDKPDGLWRSTDGGKSFKTVLQGAYLGNANYRWCGTLLSRNPKNPDELITGTYGTGAFRSEDGGKTWSKAGLEEVCVTDIRFDVRNPKRAWACALPFNGRMYGKEERLKVGFFRSEDGGKSWRKLLDESCGEIIQDPKVDRIYGNFEDSREIRKSDDGGLTWTRLTDGLHYDPSSRRGPDDTEYNAFATGPNFVLTASANGTFYRLPAGGSKWEKVERIGLEEKYWGEDWYAKWDGKGYRHFGQALASITVDPRDPKHWMFTDWYALYDTRDAGKTWKLRMDGIEVTVLHCLLQDPSDPKRVHLGMADNGYMLSRDGGAGFKAGWVNANMKSLAMDIRQPNQVFGVGDPGNGQWVSNTVFRSDDSGASWRRAGTKGLPDMGKLTANSIAVGSNALYLAVSGEVGSGAGGVYRSTDGGETWMFLGKGLSGSFFHREIWGIGREIAAGSSVVAVSDTQRSLYKLVGDEWRKVRQFDGSPNEVVADPLKDGRFYIAVAGEGVYRSDDGGDTWDKVLSKSAAFVTADAAQPGRVLAGTDDTVEYSTDAGRTWRTLDTHLPNRLRCRVAFAGNRAVVGSNGNGAFWCELPK